MVGNEVFSGSSRGLVLSRSDPAVADMRRRESVVPQVERSTHARVTQLIGYTVILCAPGIVPAHFFISGIAIRRPAGDPFSSRLYIVALSTFAFVASGGRWWGVEYACSRPSWGNLALAGVFVVGPLSSFITVSVVSWLTAISLFK